MEIKVEELRIGNKVLDDEGRICVVHCIEHREYSIWNEAEYSANIVVKVLDSECNYFGIENNEFLGIPLTDKDVKQYGHFNLIKVNDDYFVCFGNYKTQIKFLHELQNYYYLVNHEEL